MKNQYVGDVNDYHKYALLRHLNGLSGLGTMVAWMLTPDDSSNDGNKLSYLDRPEKYRRHDPTLYDSLKSLALRPRLSVRDVQALDLISNARYFSNVVPATASLRREWFESLLAEAHASDLVFFDPDNGMEVKSMRYGTKDSPKYVYHHELNDLWALGKSLLVYQHFPRKNREQFIREKFDFLSGFLATDRLYAFRSSNVVFFLAVQDGHSEAFCELECRGSDWKDEFFSFAAYA